MPHVLVLQRPKLLQHRGCRYLTWEAVVGSGMGWGGAQLDAEVPMGWGGVGVE